MYRPNLETRRVEALEARFAKGADAETSRVATAAREYKGRASEANMVTKGLDQEGLENDSRKKGNQKVNSK